jgi:hypothetical protein
MRKILTVAACAAIAMTGCSGGKKVAASSSSPPTTSATAATYTPNLGEDAASIASHIPGCTGLAAGNSGGAAGLASTATCTLGGHLVVLDSFSEPTGSNSISTMLAGNKAPTIYADGGSWVAFAADQGATADQTTLQLQIKNDAGALLRESLNGDPYPPTSPDAQKVIADTVVKALGGLTTTAP